MRSIRHDGENCQAGRPDFPLFVSLKNRLVLVVGGGAVAARRVGVLLDFGARVRIVAPEPSPEMEPLLNDGGVEWIAGAYSSRHLDGACLVVAATDDRAVNHDVGRDAGERGIPANIADNPAECDWFFPAIMKTDRLAAGLVSRNGDHALTRRAAAALRKYMEHIDAAD